MGLIQHKWRLKMRRNMLVPGEGEKCIPLKSQWLFLAFTHEAVAGEKQAVYLHKEVAEIMQPWQPERGLIKINHCKKDIFGFSVPKQCPLCGYNLICRRLDEAPVSIPSPFINGHTEKCSFLLKPTTGTFLRGYDGSSDLHVGITNTTGLVFNYNETGVHVAEHGWEQCVSVPLVQPDMYSLLKQWDIYLEKFSAQAIWLPHRYEEHFHNCYTYALTFINNVLSAQGKKQMNKSEFTEKFVIPRTRKASKYITIYKEICNNGFYVIDHHDQEEGASTGYNETYTDRNRSKIFRS